MPHQQEDLSDEDFPPLPPPYSPGQGGSVGGEDQGELFNDGEADVRIFY